MVNMKEGMRVEYVGKMTTNVIGKRGSISSVVEDDDLGDMIHVKWDDGTASCGYMPSNLKIVESGPVRTVTRKEICNGDFGPIRVKRQDSEEWPILICLIGAESRSKIPERAFTADDLRELSRIATELADALDDGA